jgi:hypothetical protein
VAERLTFKRSRISACIIIAPKAVLA